MQLCPRHKSVELLRTWIVAQLGQFGQQMQEIVVDIEIIELSQLNDRVPHHTCVCTLVRVGEQPVLPAHNKRLNSTLGAVVCEFQPAVKQERFKLFFVVQRVIHSLVEI